MINVDDKPFVEADGKHPKDKKEDRRYYSEIRPGWDSCCARYGLPYIKVDIDDYDHSTGAIKDPVNGKRKSDVICLILDGEGIKYNAVQTANGKHLYFKVPEGLLSSNRINWFTPIGIQIEWKLPTSDDHIAVKRQGKMLEWVKGDLFNKDVDFLPEWLYPMQKAKTRPFDLNILTGDRNNSLSAYAFHLVQKVGISTEGAFKAIKLMNQYVLEEPLSDDEINLILREETLEKLKTIEQEKAEKTLSHVDIGEEVIKQFQMITVNDDFYVYESGVYKRIHEKEIDSFIRRQHPTIKINAKREVIDYVKGQTYHNATTSQNALINVKNGFLSIVDDKVELLPHSRTEVRFSQFNAVYDPDAEYEPLDDVLSKVFNGNTEQIKLFEQIIGYVLMNHVRYGKVFFLIGLPSSGKSSILNMIIHFCGEGNTSSITLSTMNETFGLENIIGKTINVDADMGKIKVLSSDLFKKLSTGDEIQVKRKHKSTIDYRCTAKFFFGMNQAPDFSNDFNGVQRRIVFVPFNHVFKKTDADFNPHIDDDLSSDECMSALLNKAIKGYISLIQNKGFTETEETERASKQFKLDNNNVLKWVYDADALDRLEAEPIKNGAEGLYPEYVRYCESIGEKEKSQREFTTTICSEFEYTSKQKRIPKTKFKSMFFVKNV